MSKQREIVQALLCHVHLTEDKCNEKKYCQWQYDNNSKQKSCKRKKVLPHMPNDLQRKVFDIKDRISNKINSIFSRFPNFYLSKITGLDVFNSLIEFGKEIKLEEPIIFACAFFKTMIYYASMQFDDDFVGRVYNTDIEFRQSNHGMMGTVSKMALILNKKYTIPEEKYEIFHTDTNSNHYVSIDFTGLSYHDLVVMFRTKVDLMELHEGIVEIFNVLDPELDK